ncbi:MAG: S9 family peptidase [Flavobacteriales bacterium]|nr:S9 family peptidase [Flavobacteriales bacterium]
MRKIYLILMFPIVLLAQKKEITLENIWETYDFYPKSVSGFNSMQDGNYYSKLDKKGDNSQINKYSFRTGQKTRTLVDSKNIEIDISNYTFSKDEKKVLFANETEKIYRYSSKSIYHIYNLKTNKLEKLSDDKVMYADFSPSGDKVAYVNSNNLFVKDLSNGKTIQITTDGELNQIINGATDWVYEEEFGLTQAFFWSPDGNKIAFYKFDEREVKEFSMDMFNAELYPSQYQFKYPKAGEDNSKLSLHIYNIDDEETTTISLNKSYEYIPRMNWTKSNDLLYILAMNRHQNELDFILYNTTNSTSEILFSEKDKYYIDVHDNTTFTDDGQSLIWTSEKSGFNHIYIVNLENGQSQQVTTGNWEVTKYHGMNQDDNKVFYTSNEEGAINKSLYCINLDGSDKTKLSEDLGTHSSTFSNGMKYYSNTYSTADTPPYISLHNHTGKEIRVLEDNADLSNKMEEFDLTKKEFFSFTTSEDIELNGWMIKPSDFDPNKQYPVFMFLYGGPGSQQVVNSWGWFNYFWYQHLAQKGYIVACVDNRGTGGRGAEFKKMTYLQLGKYETIDQIEANRYLAKLPYVDENRIGIQGWSYGGYMSSLAITKGADVFKTAIAVAPVTNWRYYDNIYTERYMRTPQENASGYDDNSPINHVDSLKGNYLLIHGTADDNVHVQNTYEMVSALIKANKQFDLFVYPDKNHGIYGGNTRLHLYKLMTDYILEKL